MSRFNTGNPLDSDNLKDLSDNAKNVDLFSNDVDNRSYADRFGRDRLTIFGMESEFNLSQKDREDRFNKFLLSSGYIYVGDYAAGVVLSDYNQIVRATDEAGIDFFWRASGSISLPYTLTGEGVDEGGALVGVGDAAMLDALGGSDGASLIGAEGFTVYDAVSGRSVESGVVYASRFGIVSSASIDQTELVREVHRVANTNRLPVSYSGITNLAISCNAKIRILTDVDFCGVKIHLLSGISSEPSYSGMNTAFEIHGEGSYQVSIDDSLMSEGANRVSSDIYGKSGYLHIVSDKKMGRRINTSDELYFEQSFRVIDGICTTGVSMDLTRNSSKAYFADDDSFISIGNALFNGSLYNNQILFSVKKNNVMIYDVKKYGSYDGDSINSELLIMSCSNIVVNRVDLHGSMNSSGSGTYSLNLDRVSDVYIDKCEFIGGNGSTMGSNHINNVYINSSVFGRVDTHAGMNNLSISNTTIHEGGVIYGWGAGYLRISNSVKLGGSPVVSSRYDYSGSFYGDISISGLKIKSNDSNLGANNSIEIISFYNTYHQDVDSYVCKNLVVDNVFVDYYGSALRELKPLIMTPRDKVGELITPSRMHFSNIGLSIPMVVNFVVENGYYSRSYSGSSAELTIIGVKSIPSSSFRFLDTGGGVSGAVRVPYVFSIFNCSGVVVRCLNNSDIGIYNSMVSCIENYSGGVVTRSGKVVDSIATKTIPSGSAPRGNMGTGFQLSNIEIADQSSVRDAKYISGLRVKHGVSILTPDGASLADLLSGWVKPSEYQS